MHAGGRYPLATSTTGGIPLGSMHFAVVKITFEHDQDAPPPDRKDMSALLEKIRARFRVVVMAVGVSEEDGSTAIAYTSLAHSEESLTRQMDAIAEFCEEQGFGRVADEAVLMDDLDTIGMIQDE